MRSRYTAYTLDRIDYIMQTTHPDGPRYEADVVTWQRELDAFARGTRFAGLQILATEGDTVTFRATLFEGSRDVSFSECSLFKEHEGHWKYFSGERI